MPKGQQLRDDPLQVACDRAAPGDAAFDAALAEFDAAAGKVWCTCCGTACVATHFAKADVRLCSACHDEHGATVFCGGFAPVTVTPAAQAGPAPALAPPEDTAADCAGEQPPASSVREASAGRRQRRRTADKARAVPDGAADSKPADSEPPSPAAKKRRKSAPNKEAAETAVSQRRLKQYTQGVKSSAKPGLAITVGLTGARAGDTLHGCAEDTKNVVLHVDTGVVAAPSIIRRSVEAEVGRDALLAAFAKHFGLPASAAALRYEDCPQTESPNHQPLGQGCACEWRARGAAAGCACEPAARFTILNQGVWQRFAEAHGHGGALEALVRARRSVCFRDVLALVQTPGQPGGKTLILRPRRV
jgi:hypothetical protein